MHTHWLSAVAVVALVGSGIVTAQEGPKPDTPQRADRWVIQYTGGAFALVSRSETTKILPASDELPAVQQPLSGFWFELRAGDESVRYRRIADDPVRLVFEGPAFDGESPTAAGERAPVTGRGRGRVADVQRPASAERPSAKAGQQALSPPVRDEAIPDERTFSLLTPAAMEGDALVLFSSPLEPNAQAEPATEIARFTISPEGPF